MADDLVFDATVLSHFARASRLPELDRFTSEDRRLVPSVVLIELASGVSQHPALANALNLPWLTVVTVQEAIELAYFTRYKTEFGGGPTRNRGEAEVLAYVAAHGGTAIIDERTATAAGRRDGLIVKSTLWIIDQAHQAGHLSRSQTEQLIDDLKCAGMRLPTDGRGFWAWAPQHNL